MKCFVVVGEGTPANPKALALDAARFAWVERAFGKLEYVTDQRLGDGLDSRIAEAGQGPSLVLVHDSAAGASAVLEERRREALGKATRGEPLVSYFLLRADVFAGDVAPRLDLSLHQREAESAAHRIRDITGPILLEGETGTGKTILAEVLHRKSGRRGVFHKINCATLEREEAAFNTQFRGVVGGRYTGVAPSNSVFEEVHEGTLLLDEFQELTTERQARLLDLIEPFTSVVKGFKVGNYRETWTADVQVIVAINEPLAKLRAAGRLRPDIHHRVWRRYTLSTLRDLVQRSADPRLTFASLVLRMQETALSLSTRTNAGTPLNEEEWRDSIRRKLQVVEVERRQPFTSHPHGARLYMDVPNDALMYSWPGNFRELAALARLLLAEGKLGSWTSTMKQSFRLLTSYEAASQTAEGEGDGSRSSMQSPKRALAIAWLRAVTRSGATLSSVADALCLDTRTVRERLRHIGTRAVDGIERGPLAFLATLDAAELQQFVGSAQRLCGPHSTRRK